MRRQQEGSRPVAICTSVLMNTVGTHNENYYRDIYL